jgi:hypothetical protein
MRIMAKDGWSKDDIKQFCFENTQTSLVELKRINALPGEIAPEDATSMQPLVASAEDFIVVAAGGRVGGFSTFVPGWSGKRTSKMVTLEVRPNSWT